VSKVRTDPIFYLAVWISAAASLKAALITPKQRINFEVPVGFPVI